MSSGAPRSWGRGRTVVVGLGATGEAVARRLRELGEEVLVIEDHPTPVHRQTAESLGIVLLEHPPEERIRAVMSEVSVFMPSPGVPEAHPSFAAASDNGVPTCSEFDLAASLDSRPLVAVTGTDGKTTVTTMVTEMLECAGVRAVAAGNTDVPLVDAIRRDDVDAFVVEASSFRLAGTEHFQPAVATWLNFAEDHLDVHRSVASYEAAKARIWRDLDTHQVAIANIDDPVVAAHLPTASRLVTFGTAQGDYHVADDELRAPDGTTILAVADLVRRLPHDLANALAATATSVEAGADLDSVREVLAGFAGLPHRVEKVTTVDGVDFYDDSKATVPHATIAAVTAFESVVLIAGGRNKGLDLTPLREVTDRLRSVVAIGEAAPTVVRVFEGIVPVEVATSMDAAVAAANAIAEPGDAVLLSPGCASFDWYRSYAERGDDFQRLVMEHSSRRVEGRP